MNLGFSLSPKVVEIRSCDIFMVKIDKCFKLRGIDVLGEMVQKMSWNQQRSAMIILHGGSGMRGLWTFSFSYFPVFLCPKYSKLATDFIWFSTITLMWSKCIYFLFQNNWMQMQLDTKTIVTAIRQQIQSMNMHSLKLQIPTNSAVLGAQSAKMFLCWISHWHWVNVPNPAPGYFNENCRNVEKRAKGM